MKARDLTAKNAIPTKESRPFGQGIPLVQRPKTMVSKNTHNIENARPKTPTIVRKLGVETTTLKSNSQRRIEKPEKGTPRSKYSSIISEKSPRAKSSREIFVKGGPTKHAESIQYHEDVPTKECYDDQNCDQESDRLLDCLREGCRKQYDPARLNDHFFNILNNPHRKETQNFMPKGKCQMKRDGRQFMQVGDTEIFYDDSVLDDIINFGLRSRVSSNCNTN